MAKPTKPKSKSARNKNGGRMTPLPRGRKPTPSFLTKIRSERKTDIYQFYRGVDCE